MSTPTATALSSIDQLRAEVERWQAEAAEMSAQRSHNANQAGRLRAEVERLKKQIKDDNRSYGCELRDPNGTIWEQAAKDHARAERAEAEVEAFKNNNHYHRGHSAGYAEAKDDCEAELLRMANRAEADKARLDWLENHGWITGEPCDRAAIDAAMKEGTT